MRDILFGSQPRAEKAQNGAISGNLSEPRVAALKPNSGRFPSLSGHLL